LETQETLKLNVYSQEAYMPYFCIKATPLNQTITCKTSIFASI